MHHPPMPPSPFPPYHHWYTDVEPAYEKPAECECHFPPMPDNCVCVTEEDAHNWNYAYNIVSAVSAGLDVQAIASAAQLLTSADYWNSAYNAVTASADLWNKLPEISGKLAQTAESALWIANELSARGVFTDDSLSGNGTIEKPLGFNKEKYDELYEYFKELYDGLVSSFDIKAVLEKMQACEIKYDTAISALEGGHKQNFELILQLMGVVPNSGNYPMIWSPRDGMRSNDPASYADATTANWMFYNAYSAEG